MEKIFPLFHGESADPLLSGFIHESAASLSPAAGQVTSLAASLAEAADAEEMLTALVSHYEARGVGQLGLGQLGDIVLLRSSPAGPEPEAGAPERSGGV